ncbi:acetyl-CoA decarbonylase/synthase delta subunit [Desulfacinum infernum DSM 9756]|uniref:Acetyl-CoA decarbonylase/synthase delta subunit n=1 Tax=Desulfacinum infernum DSM 9756 TaxID=1121391 RepID=A0A1M5I9D5_9BACT|nr:acetyl-CoA decarbonylase/synthase complex subunit delta [Desulfacinum infernum]MBC7357055.1 acetyl-CoA decarbonylase/synthase complex subunit delta [Desulfacinum sp.]SHG24393.1 acetyl-CoA decarbonylase/synthase delta subunit [Desulfacinum infernum DSM 9756]
MAFEPAKQKYTGSIREVVLGTGDKAVKIGGRSAYPFYTFEGEMPNPPKVAMEIWDKDPNGEWSEVALEPFKDVVSDPVAWAKKCVEEYGAEILVIQTKSADPNAENKPAVEVAEVVKKVVDAVDVPVVVWGVANHEKDTEVMRAVAEKCAGKNVAIAPVEEGDYKQIGAACLGYKHTVVASSPIDVNLAKQLNILLNNLGVPENKIVIDPTTGGLGYGLEYTYSVMERITQAALTQGDDKLQQPIICNVANEVWKCKEANQTTEEAPELGDQKTRGVMMEAVTAIDLLLAGADVVVMRHPEAIQLVKGFIEKMM